MAVLWRCQWGRYGYRDRDRSRYQKVHIPIHVPKFGTWHCECRTLKTANPMPMEHLQVQMQVLPIPLLTSRSQRVQTGVKVSKAKERQGKLRVDAQNGDKKGVRWKI